MNMTFVESVEHVLSNYFRIDGRASRSEFWWWYLFTILASTAVSLLGLLLNNIFGVNFMPSLLNGGLNLLTLVPTFCVQVRRYHDINRSGWWMLCPVVNFIFLLLASDEGENEYGLPEGAEGAE